MQSRHYKALHEKCLSYRDLWDTNRPSLPSSPVSGLAFCATCTFLIGFGMPENHRSAMLASARHGLPLVCEKNGSLDRFAFLVRCVLGVNLTIYAIGHDYVKSGTMENGRRRATTYGSRVSGSWSLWPVCRTFMCHPGLAYESGLTSRCNVQRRCRLHDRTNLEQIAGIWCVPYFSGQNSPETVKMGGAASKTPEPIHKILLTKPAYEVRVSLEALERHGQLLGKV